MPDFRSQFADFGETAYLNCAYQGPFPLSAAARAQEAIELKCRPERMTPAEYFDLPRRVRACLARIVGADGEEIALTSGATQGIGIVAAGLNLQPRDEVIVADSNFPSNLFTWLHMRHRGVSVHVLKTDSKPVEPDHLARRITPRTKVVALDWVSYSTGARIDLAALGEIAHRQRAIFVVDGTQGVGALEVNLHDLPVDVMVVAAYKWLLGPYGSGFVCVKRELLNRLDLEVVNWLSVRGAEDFDSLPVEQFALPREARIFDVPETANFLNLYALEASLNFVVASGVSTVTDHCVRLLNHTAEVLKAKRYTLLTHGRSQLPSTILSFRAASSGATEQLHQELKARHVEVSLRHGMIRVSPYLYNNDQDVERLLAIAK
jgi:selenocysteine lyase/cysteine desulfurase